MRMKKELGIRSRKQQGKLGAVGPDALIALVRLLAREAARGFVVRASAPDSQKQPEAHDTR